MSLQMMAARARKNHSSSGPTFHSQVMADSPWGYWRLDDTASPPIATVLDYSGNSRNGTLANYLAPNVISISPLFSGETAATLYQPGTTNYVQLPSITLSANHPFTLLIAIHDVSGANGNWQLLSNDDGTNRGWQFLSQFVSGSSGPTIANFTLISPAVASVKGSVRLNDGNPHMIWAVFDPTLPAASGILKVYVDGVVDAITSTAITMSAVTGQPAVNARAGNLNSGIGNNAAMGSAAIFLSALSATRIAAQWAARNSI